MRAKSMKKTGHYCKICSEHKANEKFSGKGHAAHICKSCAAMPLEERNQAMTLTRILNLPWYLSKEQYAWLKKRCHDGIARPSKRRLNKPTSAVFRLKNAIVRKSSTM